MKPSSSIKPRALRGAQHGGFFLGVLVGLLAGLALSLGVALYVTKAPIPFINKVPQHSTEEDAAQAEKNKQWDPNSALADKTPGPVLSGASEAIAGPVPEVAPWPGDQTSATNPGAAVQATSPSRDPAAILGDKAAAADPSGASASAAAEAIVYFVQAGAYLRPEDAEQQRVRLAILGLEAKITEREQSGRTIYRIRVGPYEQREEADSARYRLEGAGIESALVRVQR